jgi:NADPH-dependent 2,4-dienoyl-CoA reductase/sulfur reductase-like enzyme
MWAQSDDVSVITDNDETGFRVMKREIEEIGLRELRRRGIGQHTIEKALHARVRADTYRKIVAAIEEYKQEKQKSGKS